MTGNVHKLKIPKMSKKAATTAQAGGMVHELPLGDTDTLTPQQLLAKLARDTSITEVMVIYAVPGEEENTENTLVHSANMEPSRQNWLLDKVKLWLMGVEI